ncbi:unnamed protein product [Phytophthora fragariaefolia]|uniref:Unnamed protein product n=1 Tax=Phytophthora fragariaefolia TaxID=1490495 RepID=A0A9W7D4U6_9STRA|nr:unnamed protein product [Phytophthora fragariaefolia]
MYKFVLWKHKLVFVAKAFNGAYYIQACTMREQQVMCNAIKTMPCRPLSIPNQTILESLLKEWHVRFGHVNKDKLVDMMSKQLVKGIPFGERSKLNQVNFFCSTCAEMKMRRMSYRNLHETRDSRPISTIHMDTNGPMKTIGVYGAVGTIRYFLNIIDDQTSWRWTYVLRNKTEVNGKVKTLLLQLEREGKFTIRRIRSDGGTEFVNQSYNKFCKDKGVLFHKSNAYCPEKNGAAERDHQTKMSKVRCALKDAGMSERWWPEALMYMTYVQNRTLMSRLQNKTPYEKVCGKAPDVSDLHIWGSTCFAHVPAERRKDKKLSARATKCRFLGV